MPRGIYSDNEDASVDRTDRTSGGIYSNVSGMNSVRANIPPRKKINWKKLTENEN